MRLFVEDMRRIVGSGDLFLLVDVRPVDVTKGASIPRALRVPFGREIVPKVLSSSGQKELPIVVCGDGPADPVAERAAELLRKEGFIEVWTYSSEPAAWVQGQRSSDPPFYVVSDPDASLRC